MGFVLLVLAPLPAYVGIKHLRVDFLSLHSNHFSCRNDPDYDEIRWEQVSEFGVGLPGERGAYVGYVLYEQYRPGLTTREKARRARIGFDGALPDTYGLTAEELAALMNQHLGDWRKRRDSKTS